MANVWQPAADFVNGGFEAGDFTGWIPAGNPRILANSALPGPSVYAMKGGSADDVSAARQVIALPADAQMVAFSSICGRDVADEDQGSAVLLFRDGSQNTIGGCFWTSRGTADDAYFIQTAHALIPPGTVDVQIVARANRGAIGTSNNGVVDSVEVDWLRGPDPVVIGPDLVLNGGFESGDFTDWPTTAGAGMSITSDAAYVSAGTFAAFGGTDPGSTLQQSVGAPPVDATALIVTAVLSLGLADQIDQLKLSLLALDGGGGVLERITFYNPMVGITQRHVSALLRLPAGTVTAAIELESALDGGGATIEAGIDTIVANWVTVDIPAVGPGPLIDVDTVPWQAIAGSQAQFSVAGQGASPVTYQWFRSPADLLVGETGQALSVAASGPNVGATFYAELTDNVNTSSSTPALLTLYPVPSLPPVVPVVIFIPDETPRVGQADYDYPCALPGVLVNSNAYSPKDRVANNPLQSGPPIFELEDDGGYVLFDVAWSFNALEMQTFRAWYRGTLASGSRLFNIELYVTGFDGEKYTETNECYFRGVYKATQVGRRWHVAATLLAINEYGTDECTASSLEAITTGFEEVPDFTDLFIEREIEDEPEYECDALVNTLLAAGQVLLVSMESDTQSGGTVLPDLTGNGNNLSRNGNSPQGEFIGLDGGALDVCLNRQFHNPELDAAWWIDGNLPLDVRVTGGVTMGCTFRSGVDGADYCELLAFRGNNRSINTFGAMRINGNRNAVRLQVGATVGDYIFDVIPQDGLIHMFELTFSYSTIANTATIQGRIDGTQFASLTADFVTADPDGILEVAFGNGFGTDTRHEYFMQSCWVGNAPQNWALLRNAYQRNFAGYSP